MTMDKPYTDRMMQFQLISQLILPWITTYYLIGYDEFMLQLHDCIYHVNNIFPEVNRKEWLLLMFSLSSPHVLYYFIWIYPSWWINISERIGIKPYKAYAYAAHLCKLQQSICCMIWLVGMTSFIDYVNNPMLAIKQSIDFLSNQHSFQLLLGIELFILGQVFNIGVYNAIGEKGVYYGSRLLPNNEKNIPWVFDFPFNVIAHPQYRGATITITGIVLLIANEDTINRGILATNIVWAFYYAFSSYIEDTY